MSYTRQIAHNTIIQIVGKVVSTFIGLLVVGMLTRYLGENGFGQYYTIMAFLQFFGILVDMGLYIILVKKISEVNVDEEKWASNIFTLRLISAVVFLGIAPVVVLFFPYAGIIKVGVLVTTLAYLGITLNQTVTGVFQKHLRMDRVMIAELVGRVVLLGGTYAVIKADLGLLWVMGSVVAGSLVNFFVSFLYSRRLVKIRLRFDFLLWRQVIKAAWPIALSILFNLVYFKADSVILSLVKNSAAVGVYGASYKVLEVLISFPAMFAGLVLPLLASAWVMADRERFKRVLQKAFDAMIIIALPLAVGTQFVARPVMKLVAPEFRDSASVLQILIFATAIIFIGNLFANAVVAVNRQKVMMWLYLAVAVVSLTGYLIFIPKYSYFGAAYMTVASELMITAAAAMIVCMVTKAWLSMTVLGKAAVASGIMAVILYFCREANIFLLLAIGFVVYSSALLLLRGVTKATVMEIIRFS
jgi:O-antigen/teichoic acid export membrane protein